MWVLFGRRDNALLQQSRKREKILGAVGFPCVRPSASAKSWLNGSKISLSRRLPFKVPALANSFCGILYLKKASLCLIPRPICGSRGGGILGGIYTNVPFCVRTQGALQRDTGEPPRNQRVLRVHFWEGGCSKKMSIMPSACEKGIYEGPYKCCQGPV